MTKDGLSSQWDEFFLTVQTWDFPIIAAAGNHDATRPQEFVSRFGALNYASQVGEIRVIVFDTQATTNGDLNVATLQSLTTMVDDAIDDPAVELIVVMCHRLFWMFQNPRYQEAARFANAYHYDYGFHGNDVGIAATQVWPIFEQASLSKPLVLFSGDAGNSGVTPSVFWDEGPSLTVCSAGMSLQGRSEADAAIVLDWEAGSLASEAVSPWGTVLAPVDTYDLSYWKASLSETGGQYSDYGIIDHATDQVLVIGAEFEMGSHSNLITGTYYPATGYSVTLSDFVIGKNEVRVSEFVEFLNDRESNDCGSAECLSLGAAGAQIVLEGTTYRATTPAAEDEPVTRVTWSGAADYCNWMSSKWGYPSAYVEEALVPGSLGWRLPTSAEFEYAQRGGAPQEGERYGRYYWDRAAADSSFVHANHLGTGGSDGWDDLAPVGSFPPNPLGINDLAGNAFEWVHDGWTSSPSGIVTDPTGPPGDQALRCIRGGGYNFHFKALRNSYRSAQSPDAGTSYVGFRIARRAPTSTDAAPVSHLPLNLDPVFPNPANPAVTIRFSVSESMGPAELFIVDVRGRRVRDLYLRDSIQGWGQSVWDGRDTRGRDAASGVYYIVLRQGGRAETQKVVLVR